MSRPWLECPCGARIVRSDEVRLVWTGRDRIDIVCPGDSCYLKEVGYIGFSRHGDKVRLKRVSFYPPFSSWNLSRLGRERGSKLLDDLARGLMKRKVSWAQLDQSRQATNPGSREET